MPSAKGIIFISGFSSKQESSLVAPTDKNEITVREIEILKDKLKQPEQPRKIVKQKPVEPKVAAVKFTTPPEIKDDDQPLWKKPGLRLITKNKNLSSAILAERELS